MATKRQVLSKYTKDNLPKYEQQFAENNGTLKGFRVSDEYKAFKRNRKRAEYRYNAKVRDIEILKTIDKVNIVDSEQETPEILNEEQSQNPVFDKIEDFEVLEFEQPYFAVLSYGSGDEKAAVAEFSLVKQIDRGRLTAIIDRRQIGGDSKPYTNANEYQLAIQRLYTDCRKIQTKLGDSAGVLVTISRCKVNGRETLSLKVLCDKFGTI